MKKMTEKEEHSVSEQRADATGTASRCRGCSKWVYPKPYQRRRPAATVNLWRR